MPYALAIRPYRTLFNSLLCAIPFVVPLTRRQRRSQPCSSRLIDTTAIERQIRRNPLDRLGTDSVDFLQIGPRGEGSKGPIVRRPGRIEGGRRPRPSVRDDLVRRDQTYARQFRERRPVRRVWVKASHYTARLNGGGFHSWYDSDNHAHAEKPHGREERIRPPIPNVMRHGFPFPNRHGHAVYPPLERPCWFKTAFVSTNRS